MIRNVVFDIGMVLADFRWHDYMLKDLGFDEALVSVFRDRLVLNKLWDEYDLGQRPPEDVVADMKAAVSEYPEEAERFFHNIVNIAEAYPYSTSWIRELQAKGYKVYLLSNYPRDTFEMHEREKFEFVKYVDGKVVSGFEGIAKPDPRIYELLLSRYGLKAKECVFLDDRQVNIDTARSLGFSTILFTSYDKARETLNNLLRA